MQTNKEQWDDRTRLLLNETVLKKLKQSHILVAGVGGVGGYVCEFLARAGVGHLTIIDSDTVQTSNLNRQIIATRTTLGQPKTKVMRERLLNISPYIEVECINEFYTSDLAPLVFTDNKYDFAVDAIDSLSSKVSFLVECKQRAIEVVSSMGAGEKLAPEQVQIADISQTHHCRLAANVRRRLRKLGINTGIEVVFSDEQNIYCKNVTSNCNQNSIAQPKENNTKKAIGTVSYLPAIFGGFLASVVIRRLTKKDSEK